MWGTAKSLKRFSKQEMIAEGMPGHISKMANAANASTRRRGGGFRTGAPVNSSGVAGSVSSVPGEVEIQGLAAAQQNMSLAYQVQTAEKERKKKAHATAGKSP